MTDHTPKRRGRPPRFPPSDATMDEQLHPRAYAPEAELEPRTRLTAAEEAEEAAEQPKRRRRARVGGFAMKLSAPSRPGFTRRWVNDSGNRLAEAEELGYTHVTDTGVKTSAPGSRISRLVGTQASGEPLQAFLMETPDELYAEGIAEREALARTVDEAISRGDGTTDGQMSQIPKEERYGHGSIRPDR